MQVTVIGGKVYQNSVSGVAQFKKLRKSATHKRSGFFELCETCAIKRSEIIAVEYFEVSEDEK